MIIQIPRGASIVLRFDSPDAADFGTGQTITLLGGSEPSGPAFSATAPRSSGFRRRTMFACGAGGLVVAALGVTLLNSSLRAEQTTNLSRGTVWDDSRPVMPDRMRAELAHGPTVVPPAETPMPPSPGQPADAPPRNPFGLE